MTSLDPACSQINKQLKKKRFCASTTGDGGSIPSQGTKIPYAMWYAKKLKTKNKLVIAWRTNTDDL